MAYLERLKGMNIVEYFSIARKAVTKWVVGAHTSEELLGAHGTPPMQFVTSLLDLDTLVGCIGANWVDFMFKYGGTSAIQDIGSGGKGRNLQRYEGFNFSDFLTQAFSSGLFRDPLDRMIYAQTSKLHWCRFDKQASCAVNCEVELFDDGVVLKVAKPIMECARLNSIDIKKEVLKIKDKHKREFPKKYAPFLHDLKKFCTIFSGDHECVRSVKEITIRALDGLVANFPKSFVDDHLAIDLIEAYIWNHLNPVEWNYLYYGTEIVAASPYSSGICIGTTNVIPDDALQYIAALLDIFFGAVYYILHAMDLRKQQTKSAIGSIMSRNGSHNIGSHVLAALSHNVGTMPDDRVLYQYIQHRMDYIATATTEFPTWRQPVLFVSSVMKQFMMQKHLLNFISRSEGLSAYQFQNSALTATTQPNTIRIHIRRVHNDVVDWEGRGAYSKSEYDNFVSYMAEDPHSLEKDVYVAIPGGIVGQHAFYTILENILRNAAKHEWATAHNKKDHLDLYVDFRDNPVSGKVEFQIWNDRASKGDSKDEGDNEEDITKIVEKLEARMTCRFIDPDGQLRKENWGLAEMRISAGFLIGSDVSLIGGIGVDDKEMLSLIRPVTIKNCEGRDCLGYRFDLYKPKELLIVLPDEVTSGETPKFSEKTVEKLNALLAQYGINVISETKAKDSKGLAYSYVLFDKFNGKIQGMYNLPFRVLYTTEKRGMTNEQEDACAIAKYKGSFKDVISGLEGLSAQGEGSAASAFAYGVLELVYSSWVKHVINQRRDISGPHALIVDMKDDGGGGKSLFSNANLLYFVFENSFNSAVRSYLAAHTPSTLNSNLAGALYAMTKLSPRPQYTAKELSEEVDSDDDVANMILVQMVKWADLAKTDGRILKGYKTDDEDGLLLPLQDEWVAAGIWQTCFSAWNPRAGLELLLDGLLGNNSAACAEMGDFIAYIGGTILEQARAYLAKYEERHSTLPAWFEMSSEQQDEADVEWKVKHGDEEVFSQKIAFSSNCDKKETGKKSAFCYWRHGDDVARNNSRLPVDDRAIYLEPLSGSQSYLNAFKELNGALSVIQKHSKGKVLNEVEIAQRNNAIRFVTELVENSVMRVLIIDERMRKFADEHPDVASIFVSTGICILGGEEEIAAGLFKAYRAKNGKSTKKVFARKIDGIPIGKFEIVIIHQGIIDKQLEGLDKTTSIEDFYVWLKSNMRYVVITTGRGTPPNVPPGARVLPFSVVESTLFKRYPEKLLLVDTVMNMLPIGERSQS